MFQNHLYIVVFLILASAFIQTHIILRELSLKKIGSKIAGFFSLFFIYLLVVVISTPFFVVYIHLMNWIFNYPYGKSNQVIWQTILGILLVALFLFSLAIIKTFTKGGFTFREQKDHNNSFSKHQLNHSLQYVASLSSMFTSLSLGAYTALLYINQWKETPEYLIETDELLKYNLNSKPEVFPTLLLSSALITLFQLFFLCKTRNSQKSITAFDTLTEHLDNTYNQLIADWEALKHYQPVAFERFAVIDRFVYQDKDTYDQIRLENSRIYEESDKLIKATSPWRPDSSNHHSMMASSQGIIRGLSAEKDMLKIINNIPGTLIDKTYQFQGTSVELDAVIVNDKGIYLIELKNYKADKIVIEASGVAYRIHGNKEHRMNDLLEQVARARDIVREIVRDVAGPNINIYNVIAFADKDTKIVNELESDNLMFFDLGYLSFAFQNKKYSNPLNDQIIDKLLSVEIPERKFEFYDIFAFKNEVIEAYQHDLPIYNNWYEHHEKVLEEIKAYQVYMEEKLQEIIQQSKLNRNIRNFLIKVNQKMVHNYFNKKEKSILKNLDIPKDEIDVEIKELNKRLNLLMSQSSTSNI